MKQSCGNCRYYITPQCWEKKNSGKHPDPDDWCAGWKQMTLADQERREDARNEAVTIRGEMAERGKV